MTPSAQKPNEQDRNQPELRQSVKWLRTLLAHSYDALVLTSAEGTPLFASPSIQRILGYTPEEYVTLNRVDLTHPDHLDEEPAILQRILEQPGVSLSPQQTRLRHKDGSWRWIEYTATNLLNDPNIAAIVFHLRDITESKRADETQHLLAAIVSSSDDAIVSKTLQGIITSWNAAAERLFGYTAAEAVGQAILLIIPPELHHEEVTILSKLRRGERIDHYETVRLRKDGTKVNVSLSISPVRDRQGKVIGAAKIARDITERVRLEQRKDEFISMASHELKTPVTSLKGFTAILQRYLSKQKDEQGLTYLAKIERQIDRLIGLVSELLDISRIQTGKLTFQEEVFDLSSLAREMVENVQQTTQTHRLYLESADPVQVMGDRERIGQVLMNLLTNAIKYSPRSDRVIISVTGQADQARMSVQDFGIGIAPEHQQHIFERFYQVTGSDGNTFPGLGIGLYLSNEIVSRHGGHIVVESAPERGSTFTVSLPQAQEGTIGTKVVPRTGFEKESSIRV